MKHDIALKWIEALPHYKQTTGILRKGDKFCCLGVLCELYRQETGEGEWTKGKFGLDTFVISQEHEDKINIISEDGILPKTVQQWAGLKHANGLMDKTSLACMNDNGMDFNTIAGVIERNIDEL